MLSFAICFIALLGGLAALLGTIDAAHTDALKQVDL